MRDLTKVGPWKVQTVCVDQGTETGLIIMVNGPAGSYQFMQATRDNDSGAFAFESSGSGFPQNFPTAVLSAVTSDGQFQRVVGTAQVHATSGEAAMLEVNALADARNVSTPRCSISGIAIPAA